MRFADLNNFATFCSASPSHLDIIVDASTFIKWPSISDATAAASNVFPVPGGPYNNIPLGQPSGKRSGRIEGKVIDSLNAFLASSLPTISSQLTFGFSCNITSSYDALTISTTPD